MEQSEDPKDPKEERNTDGFVDFQVELVYLFNGRKLLSSDGRTLSGIMDRRKMIIDAFNTKDPLTKLRLLERIDYIYYKSRCERDTIEIRIGDGYNGEVMHFITNHQDIYPDLDFTSLFLNDIPIELSNTKSAHKSNKTL